MNKFLGLIIALVCGLITLAIVCIIGVFLNSDGILVNIVAAALGYCVGHQVYLVLKKKYRFNKKK